MKNYQALCELCEEGQGEYGVDLITNGITKRMMVCAICKAMTAFRKGDKHFTNPDALAEYFNGGGAWEDLSLKTREKIENEEHTLDTECPNWFN